MKRKLQRTGNDQYLLTVPKAFVEALDWHEKEELDVRLEKKGLRIVKRKRGGRDE